MSQKYAVEIQITSLDITRGILKSDSDYIKIHFRRNTVFVIYISKALVPITLKTKNSKANLQCNINSYWYY